MAAKPRKGAYSTLVAQPAVPTKRLRAAKPAGKSASVVQPAPKAEFGVNEDAEFTAVMVADSTDETPVRLKVAPVPLLVEDACASVPTGAVVKMPGS